MDNDVQKCIDEMEWLAEYLNTLAARFMDESTHNEGEDNYQMAGYFDGVRREALETSHNLTHSVIPAVDRVCRVRSTLSQI